MTSNPRAPRKKKGPVKGTGGHGRKALQGKGPTPRAEDRPYHKAYRPTTGRAARPSEPTRRRPSEDLVTGRNAVLEALRAGAPAKTLYVAVRADADERVAEALQVAADRGVPLLEASKPELDRLTHDAVHQGLALQIQPYEYPDAVDLAQSVMAQYTKGYIKNAPLLVALDSVTDPRNLGAIIRSVAAFSGHGVIVPQRRSVSMTAAAWKSSAGAAARVPVAKATNLNQAIDAAKRLGYFVLGLDGDGTLPLPELNLATEPVVLVVGSEGKGMSRLTREKCDATVAIPIDSSLESLNAATAVGISLYEVSRRRTASGT